MPIIKPNWKPCPKLRTLLSQCFWVGSFKQPQQCWKPHSKLLTLVSAHKTWIGEIILTLEKKNLLWHYRVGCGYMDLQ